MNTDNNLCLIRAVVGHGRSSRSLAPYKAKTLKPKQYIRSYLKPAIKISVERVSPILRTKMTSAIVSQPLKYNPL